MNNLNKNFLPLAIILAGALIGGAIFYINQEEAKSLTSEEAAQKAIEFINQTIEENVTASLLEVVDDGLVYKIRLEIADTEYESYITKDGKLLFPSGFNLEEQTLEEITQEEPLEEQAYESNVLDSFAQCLTEKNMKFYGSKYCGWCNQEKELFGESLQYLTYIECVDAETDEWLQTCKDVGISAVPTWQLPDGQMESGFKTLEQLAEISSCPLE